MLRLARSLAASCAALAVVAAATGWLYLIQPHSALPGPPVSDALPLDELSRRSAVPVLVFLGVWIAAALLLGLIVRIGRTERLTAGLMLALGVGGWAYVTTGISLLIVRQVPAHQAFHAAAGQQAIYLPATLAGLAGALCARGRVGQRPRSPLVLAWFVAAAGLLGVLDAVLPNERPALIASLAPEHVHGVSEALVAPLGLVLLVAARGLARGKRRAWQVALAVLLGLDCAARFNTASGMERSRPRSWRSRCLRGAPTSTRRAIRRHVRGSRYAHCSCGSAIFGICVRRTLDQPCDGGSAVHLALRRARSSAWRGWSERDRLGPSVRNLRRMVSRCRYCLLALTAVGILLLDWLAPWRYRHAARGARACA